MTEAGFYHRDQSGELLFSPDRVAFPDGTSLDANDPIHRSVVHNGWRWYATEAEAEQGDYSGQPNIDPRYGQLYDQLIASSIYQSYVGALMAHGASVAQCGHCCRLGLVLAVGQFSSEELAELAALLEAVGLAETYPITP